LRCNSSWASVGIWKRNRPRAIRCIAGLLIHRQTPPAPLALDVLDGLAHFAGDVGRRGGSGVDGDRVTGRGGGGGRRARPRCRRGQRGGGHSRAERHGAGDLARGIADAPEHGPAIGAEARGHRVGQAGDALERPGGVVGQPLIEPGHHEAAQPGKDPRGRMNAQLGLEQGDQRTANAVIVAATAPSIEVIPLISP
jgi:hypothetical protein